MQLKHLLQYSVLAAALASGAAQAQNVVLYSSNNTETIETALDAVKQKSPKLNVQPVTGPVVDKVHLGADRLVHQFEPAGG